MTDTLGCVCVCHLYCSEFLMENLWSIIKKDWKKKFMQNIMIAVLQDNICATNLDLEYKP